MRIDDSRLAAASNLESLTASKSPIPPNSGSAARCGDQTGDAMQQAFTSWHTAKTASIGQTAARASDAASKDAAKLFHAAPNSAALPSLDANANAVAIEHIKLQNEGWERD